MLDSEPKNPVPAGVVSPGGRSAGCAEEPQGLHSKVGARRWLVRLLVVALLALGLGTLPLQIFGERGLTRYRRLQKEHRSLAVRNQRLARDIRQMELEVRRLRDDDVTLERAARDDLGMVRAGELIFVVDQ